MEIKDPIKDKAFYLESGSRLFAYKFFSSQQRGMDVSPYCRECFFHQETIDHALCGCKRAQKICDHIFDRVDSDIVVQNNSADRIILLANTLTEENLEKVCIAFWAIWTDRNGQRNGKPIMVWQERCE